MAVTIFLALPSRGRPEAVRECIRSAWAAADLPQRVGVVVRLDEDDPWLSEYRLEDLSSEDERVMPPFVVTGPRQTLGMAFDEAGMAALHWGASAVVMTGDDIRFQSAGWDTTMLSALGSWRDRIGFVYGRDGIHDERLGTHGAVSAEWLEAVGFYIPHALLGSCADVWLNDLARELGRAQYLPTVYTEHFHPEAGKASWDRTYRDRRNGRERYRRVHEEGLFDQALAGLRRAMS